MKRLLYLFLLLVHSSLFASVNDSLRLRELIIKDLKLHTTLEDSVFKHLCVGQKVSMLDMMVASDKTLFYSDLHKIKRDIVQFVSKLKSETEDMDLKMKVDFIFNTVHQQYLNKYQEGAMFSELFNNGTYNCVTATALYAHLFNELNIPYTIHETPDHVYIIVDPKGRHILVESTDPNGGSKQPTMRQKTRFIDFIIENKIATNSEYDSLGREEFFRKYYYSNVNIKDFELIGLQYFNISLINYEAGRLLQSFTSAEKAYLLRPSVSTKHTLALNYLSLSYKFAANNEDSAYINILPKLYHLLDTSTRTQVVASVFNLIARNLLGQTNQVKLFKTLYKRCSEEFGSDTPLINKLTITHHLELAKKATIEEQYPKAIQLLYLASLIDTTNLDIKKEIEFTICKKISVLTSPQSALNFLNELTEENAHILRYKFVGQLYAVNYFKMLENSITLNQKEETELYFNLLEKNGTFYLTKDDQLRIYQKAKNHFQKNGNYKMMKHCDSQINFITNRI